MNMKKYVSLVVLILSGALCFAQNLSGYKQIKIGDSEETVRAVCQQMGFDCVFEQNNVVIKGKDINKKYDADLMTKKLTFRNPLFGEKATFGLKDVTELTLWFYEDSLLKIEMFVLVTPELQQAFVQKYKLSKKGLGSTYMSKNGMKVEFDIHTISILDTSKKAVAAAKKEVEKVKQKHQEDLQKIMDDM